VVVVKVVHIVVVTEHLDLLGAVVEDLLTVIAVVEPLSVDKVMQVE
jgi:hypothetical protein